MKRRNFFQGILKAAAILALAPQLAFRARPSLPSVALGETKTIWFSNGHEVVEYIAHDGVIDCVSIGVLPEAKTPFRDMVMHKTNWAHREPSPDEVKSIRQAWAKYERYVQS